MLMLLNANAEYGGHTREAGSCAVQPSTLHGKHIINMRISRNTSQSHHWCHEFSVF